MDKNIKKKQPNTVRIIDPKKVEKLSLINELTGIPIQRIVDLLLEAGLKVKNFEKELDICKSKN